MMHPINFMKEKNISKETIWAVSIIILCVLTGCFLLIKTMTGKPDVAALSTDGNAIVLQEINTEDTNTKPIELLIENENTNTELFTENENTESTELSIESNDITPVSDSDTATVEITNTTYDCPIDFESLWETNEDVYAWITVPGTVIDYPILQHETDDSYYLNYTIDGIEGYPGCIYTETVNAKDFTDNNTVIYGHNMRNGTMFTDLHKFREEEFFNEHDTVYIYTPEKQLAYKIFAAYLYDDRHLMNSFDFSDPEVYAGYLSEIQHIDSEDMNMRKEIKVTDADKIITLITCIREQPEKRVYVQAVLQPDNL